MSNLRIFAGSSKVDLAKEICACLDIEMSRLNINTFSIGSSDCSQYRQCEPRKKFAHLTLLSVAPLLAETIKRIDTGESVGALFK